MYKMVETYFYILSDLCNDGLRQPTFEDIGKMSHPDFEEKNVVTKQDFDDTEFKNIPQDSIIPGDYGENDFDNIEDVVESQLMITNKINDNFDVSSHGSSNINYPHSSITLPEKNRTSPVVPASEPTNMSKTQRNDGTKQIIKGKDSNFSKAKGNLQVKSDRKNLDANDGISQYKFGCKLFLVLQFITHILYSCN